MYWKLRTYRTTHKLSTKDLAKKLGISEHTLRSLENGWRPITPQMAVKVEQSIGISRHVMRPDIFGKAA